MFIKSFNESTDNDFEKDFKMDSSQKNTKEESGDTDTREGDSLVLESIIDDEIEEGTQLNESDIYELFNEGLLLERSIVRLDKYAKKNLRIKKTAIVIAKEKKSKYFGVLKKAYIAKRWALANIMKLYETQARARVARVKAKKPVNSLLNMKKGNGGKSTKSTDIRPQTQNKSIPKMGFSMNSVKMPKNAADTRRFKFDK